MTSNYKRNQQITTAIIHLILILFAIIMNVPFIWMALTAFKTVTEATSVNPFVIFPSEWRFDAFETVWKNMNFTLLYINILLLIFWRVVAAVLTATLAGYAFARLDGCNIFQTILFVMAPLARSSMVALGIFTAVS